MSEVLLPVLGIDVSKAKLHMALLRAPRQRPKRKVVK